MRIDSGYVGMDSARLYKSATSTRVSYGQVDVNAQGNEDALTSFSNLLSNDAQEEEGSEVVASNESMEDKYDILKPRNVNIINQRDSVVNSFQKLHQLMLRHIFNLLFGDKSDKLFDINDVDCGEETVDLNNMPVQRFEIVRKEFTSTGYFEESESTSFNAVGNVRTSDGREININLNVAMSRSFSAYYENHFSSAKLKLCDPLVINFDENIAGLEENMDFYFDLDTDGEEEKIAKLTSGSGFLALDLNEDGIINDGSELFGPESGDGFKDLSAYDEDGNGWIDEGDSIFEKLKIWTKDENGNDVLYTLKDKNIGALFTGSVDTQFSLNDVNNATRGYIRSTGMFLYEDGMAGTMQHVDLVS